MTLLRLRRPWPIAILALLPALSCSGRDPSVSGGEPPLSLSQHTSQLESTLHVTIQTGLQSPVTIQTMPKAICQLHMADDPNGMQLNATDEGFVHFYESAATDTVVQMLLDCRTDDGTSPTQVIEFTATSSAEAVARAHQSEPAVVEHTIGTPRPALTGDLMAYTQSELLSAGYPPRPDPVRTPSGYQTWLRAVSAPATRVSSRAVPVQTQAAPQVQNNWSGYAALPQPSNAACVNQSAVAVQGDWVVPPVAPHCLSTNVGFSNCINGYYYAYEWIGIDGGPGDPAANDFLQDGTGGEIFCPGGGLVCSTKYIAWEEYFPTQSSGAVEFPNLTVSPGNEVIMAAWVGDQNQNPVPNGGYIYFYFQNVTAGMWVGVSGPQAHRVDGYMAEWIMERPKLNGSFTNMAEYGTAPSFTANMKTAEWYDSCGNWNVYSTKLANGSPVVYEMHNLDNGLNTLLSSAGSCNNGDSTCMTFQFHHFN